MCSRKAHAFLLATAIAWPGLFQLVIEVKVAEASGEGALEPFPAFVDGPNGREEGGESGEVLVAGSLGDAGDGEIAFGGEALGGGFGRGKGRGDFDEGVGAVFAEEVVAESDGDEEGVGGFLGEEIDAGADFEGGMGGTEFALGEDPESGAVLTKEAAGVAEGGGSAERAIEIDGEGTEPGEETVVPELFFLHHAVGGLAGEVAGEEVDEDAVPPVGVVAEDDDGAVGGEVAEVVETAGGDGVESATGEAAEIEVEERVEEIVFLGGDHGGV